MKAHNYKVHMHDIYVFMDVPEVDPSNKIPRLSASSVFFLDNCNFKRSKG
jgi:hypothetical protein